MTAFPSQKWFDKNTSKDPGYSVKKFVDYVGSGNGISSTCNLALNVTKLARECGFQDPVLKSAGDNLRTALDVIAFTRLIPTAHEAFEANDNLINPKDDGVSTQRKSAIAAKKNSEMAVAWGSAFNLFAKIPAINVMTNTVGLVGNTTDLGLSISDYSESSKLETEASGDAKEVFGHTKRYNLIRIAKAVTSVVSGVLGLLVLALGGPILPAVVLITISLASTVLGIVRDNYKDTGKFKAFNFDRDVRPLKIA